ncbi:MAG: hypothetical protein RSA22_02460 [Acinetobacter sp.]
MKYLTHISGLFFLISPILSNYVFWGALSIGDMTLLLSLIFFINQIKINNFLIICFFMSSFVVLISYSIFIYNGQVPSSFYRASFYLMILPLFLSLSKSFYLLILHKYLKVSLILSIFLITQLFFYYIFNITLIMQLPIETIEDDTLNVIEIQSGGFRAAGLFREPSYLAIYLIPALLYYTKYSILDKYFFYFLILIASTSSLGIFFAILSLFFVGLNAIKFKKSFTSFIILFPVLLVGFLGYMVTTTNVAILRFFDLTRGGGSLEERFFNMFKVLQDFSFFVNFDLSKKVLIYNFNETWYNSFVYLVSNFGLIFIIPFCFFWSKVGLIGMVSTLILLILTHSFSSPFFTIFLLICYCIFNKNFSKPLSSI